jgi:hypothetical protein
MWMVRWCPLLNAMHNPLDASLSALVDAIATDINAEDFDLSFTGIGFYFSPSFFVYMRRIAKCDIWP